LIVVLDECVESSKSLVQDFLLLHAKTKLPFTLVTKRRKEGLAKAKNVGLELCTGDWITYCDADDQWLPCKLEVQEKAIEEQAADICFTQAWDSYDGLWKPNCFEIGQYRTHEEIKGRIFQENVLCHGSAMFRKSLYDTVVETHGHFYSEDERYLGKEDWELWQRIMVMHRSVEFYNVPERLYVYSMGTSVER
jgi:glycosyltransferase involved in cell wall biosynthesis